MSCSRFEGVESLTAGQTSFTVNNLNLPKKPRAGRGDVMKGSPGGALISANADKSSFAFSGGTFYFGAPIPSDTTYDLFYEFLI